MQLIKVFFLHLTRGELASVFSIFANLETGKVDGANFMNSFFKVKHEEKDRRMMVRKEREQKLLHRQHREAEEVEARR